MIVTIDGPAGSGKSTVARLLADKMGIRYLDTGAMYRAVALAVIQSQCSSSDADAVSAVAQRSQIDFQDQDICLNGTTVTEQIRSSNVTAVASVVAAYAHVRERLVELQQEIGRDGDLVTEGRDQGTVVFPQASHKFFITASLGIRATRRHKEMVSKGDTRSLQQVEDELEQRDERDRNRPLAPMKPAPDASVIDTSQMGIDEVVEMLISHIQSTDPSD